MVTLTFQTVPGGLNLIVGGTSAKSAFTRNVIVGSSNTVSAVSPQAKGSKQYTLRVLVRRRRSVPHDRRPGYGRRPTRPATSEVRGLSRS